MNPGGQIGQEAIASMEIEMMTDLYNRWVHWHPCIYYCTDCTHLWVRVGCLTTRVGCHLQDEGLPSTTHA